MKRIILHACLVLTGYTYTTVSSASSTTPLHTAIVKNDIQELQELLSSKENLDTPNQSGDTPLLSAARLGNDHMMQLLLEAGADPNISDRFGQTPLLLAISWGKTNMIPTLLDAGANPNTPGSDEKTPLERAAEINNVEIVEHLLKRGAHPLTETQLEQLPSTTLKSIIATLQNRIAEERRKALTTFEEEIIETGLAQQPGAIPYLREIIHDFAETPIQQRGQKGSHSAKPSSTETVPSNSCPMILMFE